MSVRWYLLVVHFYFHIVKYWSQSVWCQNFKNSFSTNATLFPTSAQSWHILRNLLCGRWKWAHIWFLCFLLSSLYFLPHLPPPGLNTGEGGLMEKGRVFHAQVCSWWPRREHGLQWRRAAFTKGENWDGVSHGREWTPWKVSRFFFF